MLTHRNLVANAKHTIIGLGYGAERPLPARRADVPPRRRRVDLRLTWVRRLARDRAGVRAGAVLAAIEEERVTRTLLVPTMINVIVDHPERSTSATARRCAGSPTARRRCPPSCCARRWSALDCEWAQAYGMTEAAPLVTFCPPEDHRRGPRARSPTRRGCDRPGTPVVGVEVEVRRPDGSRRRHRRGRARSTSAARTSCCGYWNRPEETAAALVATAGTARATPPTPTRTATSTSSTA